MSRDEIERMVQEAGGSIHDPSDLLTLSNLERFAALVAAAERERIIAQNTPEIEKINEHIKALEETIAAEREACANECEAFYSIEGIAQECAAAIRARSKHD